MHFLNDKNITILHILHTSNIMDNLTTVEKYYLLATFLL